MNIQELRQNNIAINTVRDENYKNATFFPFKVSTLFIILKFLYNGKLNTYFHRYFIVFD